MTIDSGEFVKRVFGLVAEELQRDSTWWYLSFAGDEGWRGGIFTRSQGITTGLMKANRLGINPGGEVCSIRIGEPGEDAQSPTIRFDLIAQNADKLITDRKELEMLFGEECKTARECEEAAEKEHQD